MKNIKNYGSPHFCSLLQPPVTSSLLNPNIPLSILFLDMLSLCSYFSVRDHSSYPYSSSITLLKIIFLLSGKPSSWLPRKLKLVMHDVLRKSLRFPKVTLKKNQDIITNNLNDKFKDLAAKVHYFLLLKNKYVRPKFQVS